MNELVELFDSVLLSVEYLKELQLYKDELFKNSFKEYIAESSNTKEPGEVIFEFISSHIHSFDDENFLQLLYHLKLIPNQDQSTILTPNYQKYVSHLNNNSMDIHEELGLPSTAKILFVPDGYDISLDLNIMNTICNQYKKPSLKLDTCNFSTNLNNSGPPTPIVVLDTSCLNV